MRGVFFRCKAKVPNGSGRDGVPDSGADALKAWQQCTPYGVSKYLGTLGSGVWRHPALSGSDPQIAPPEVTILTGEKAHVAAA